MSVAARHSGEILARLLSLHPKKIDLVLDRIARLLAALDHPERNLPPIIHVAGTNGKGSTCAFARAMLEAQGFKVHVYTSPHLVHFHERIRLAGSLISEDELAATLDECELVNDGAPITFFEITTAAAFLAFSRHKADALILEVGLGGKYDATNVIAAPQISVITPVGLDHQEFLGSSLANIAAEKAGIIKQGRPVVVGVQEDLALDVISRRADALSAPHYIFGQDFFAHQEHGRMVYQDTDGLLDLAFAETHWPPSDRKRRRRDCCSPLRYANCDWGKDAAVERGLRTVEEWPARLQHLSYGPLIDLAPKWFGSLARRRAQSARRRRHLARGGRSRRTFGAAALSHLRHAQNERRRGISFGVSRACPSRHHDGPSKGGKKQVFGAGSLYDAAREAGLDASPAEDLEDAMIQVSAWSRANDEDTAPRILICGSLYLAGKVLAENR